MKPRRLYAKSADKVENRLTLPEHTADVMNTAEALFIATGEAQLLAVGLEPAEWRDRFRRDLLIAALLHDLGKANSKFQEMIDDVRKVVRQPIRHEAVSYWIVRQPKVRDWLETAVGGSDRLDTILWAVAGHHRKFPQDYDSADPVTVFLDHDDFRASLALGVERLNLPVLERLDDATILFSPPRDSVGVQFDDAFEEAYERFESINDERPDEKRYISLLKAFLIGADVAGSIRFRGKLAMAEWIGEAFRNVPSIEQLAAVVTKKLGINELRDFQKKVGEAKARVVFVRAGCGTGKTLAAYHWAAEGAKRSGRGSRIFFCYPTTGTASEGYRDYLKDVDLDKALIHGRADVDMELLGLGDDERVPEDAKQKEENPEDEAGRGAMFAGGALEHWSTPLVSCTVDTVLGLLQNNRRGLYLWPSLASSCVVFDEIHSYDDSLFDALVRFLTEVRGVRCLLMTASLPESRRKRLGEALGSINEALEEIPGPRDLEEIKRYRRHRIDGINEPLRVNPDLDATAIDRIWDQVHTTLNADMKVLWVVNTVEEAIHLYESHRAEGTDAKLYHSRFKYEDRVERHKDVINAFKPNGKRAFAITSQVAEMSLDLSADLLVTQLAPISALIQRLGRLNRRALRDEPWPFIVYPPSSRFPYEQADLDGSSRWLEGLGQKPLSQSDLATAWENDPVAAKKPNPCKWFDGGFETRPGALRKASPGIEIILPADIQTVESDKSAAARLRIPMTPPKGKEWHDWKDLAFCKVPLEGCVTYDPMKGARWIP